MLAAGVRYRFANGLRAAMRVWGAVLVACVIAVGLKASLPFVAWGHAWMAMPLPRRALVDIAVGLAFGLFARGAFVASVGSWGAEQMRVLPLTFAQRFAIDCASVVLYLTPPMIALVASCRSFEPLLSMVIACGIGAVPFSDSVQSRRPTGVGGLEARPPIALPYEWGWWVRVAGGRVPWAIVTSTITAAASVLAINNNRVVTPLSILRIEALFVAYAAGVLASAILASRDLARPYRVSESVLPVSAAARLQTLLATSLPLMLAPLAALALLRFSPGALVYGVVVFAVVLLFGEGVSLRGGPGNARAMAVALIAAVAGAIDARVALVIAIVALPLVWRRALNADATSDLRVIRMEAA